MKCDESIFNSLFIGGRSPKGAAPGGRDEVPGVVVMDMEDVVGSIGRLDKPINRALNVRVQAGESEEAIGIVTTGRANDIDKTLICIVISRLY